MTVFPKNRNTHSALPVPLFVSALFLFLFLLSLIVIIVIIWSIYLGSSRLAHDHVPTPLRHAGVAHRQPCGRPPAHRHSIAFAKLQQNPLAFRPNRSDPCGDRGNPAKGD
jgi:hypothetical protein